MHPAKKLLIWLLFRASLRLIRSQLRTPLGILLAILGFGSILAGMVPSILFLFVAGPNNPLGKITTVVPEAMPFGLLLISVYSLCSQMGRQILELKPAELHFILAGPFSDRSILTYRISTFAISLLPISVIAAIVMVPYGQSILGVWLSIFLSTTLISLLNLCLALLEVRWPRLITFLRILVVGLLALSIVEVALPWLRNQVFPLPLEMAQEYRATLGGNLLLWPFDHFRQIITAKSPSQFVGGAWFPTSASIIMLWLCYALNVGFAEMAAEGSDRRRMRIERFQRGSVSFGSAKTTSRWSLPGLPWWGGMGPVAWSQLTTTVRKRGSLLWLLVVVVGIMTIGYWGFARRHWVIEDRVRELVPMMAMVGSAYFGFLFVITCQLGFSAPLPQMIWYKSLPIQEWRIALGVSIGIVVFLWVVRTLAIIPAYWITNQPLLSVMAIWFAGSAFDWLLVVCINVVACNTNLRFSTQGPPDVLQGGRILLLMLMNLLAIFPGILLAGLFCGVVFILSEKSWMACSLALAVGFLTPIPFYLGWTAWGLRQQELKVE